MHSLLLLAILLAIIPCSLSTPAFRRRPRPLPHPLPAIIQQTTIDSDSNLIATDDSNLIADLTALSDLLTGHYTYDHVEPYVAAQSKKIAVMVTDAFNVRLERPKGGKRRPSVSVDFTLLRGQLDGSIESYLTDALSPLWHQRTLSKPSIHSHIQETIALYCPPPSQLICIEQNAHDIHYSISNYIQVNLAIATKELLTYDLPPLVLSTRGGIEGIVSYFNGDLDQGERLIVEVGELQVAPLMDDISTSDEYGTTYITIPAEDDEWGGKTIKDFAKVASLIM